MSSDTFIFDDVSNVILEIHRQKLDISKQKRREGYIVYFSGIEIITKRRRISRYNASNSIHYPVLKVLLRST